jgi:hypothetical protein
MTTFPTAPESKRDKVFLSYRRNDRAMSAGRIYDFLVGKLGEKRVFIDVKDICLGREWLAEVGIKIDQAEALLAIIGPNWLRPGFRSDEEIDLPEVEDDCVVLEIDRAAKNKIPIVPVLVDGATLPKKDGLPKALRFLPDRQAFTVSHEKFAEDASRLLAGLQLSKSAGGLTSWIRRR